MANGNMTICDRIQEKLEKVEETEAENRHFGVLHGKLVDAGFKKGKVTHLKPNKATGIAVTRHHYVHPETDHSATISYERGKVPRALSAQGRHAPSSGRTSVHIFKNRGSLGPRVVASHNADTTHASDMYTKPGDTFRKVLTGIKKGRDGLGFRRSLAK